MIRRVANVVACLSLLALIGYSAFAWQRRVDERASARYDQTLRSLLALDFRLTAEIMKARASVVGHYDGIVQAVAARKRLERVLAELPRGVWPAAQEQIRARLREGQRKRRETEALVERFKRENAVLRNSLRFLSVLAEELETAHARSASSQPYAAIGQLVRDELLLQSWQDASLIGHADRALASLVQLDAVAPGGHDQALLTLLSHARVVRESTPVVQALTRQIVASDDARWTERMLATFLQRHRAARQLAEFDAGVCFALALIVLASAAASIILAQQRAATALRSTSDQLAQAVDSLRVEQAKQKELSELKSRFVSMASHEFRTPLSVIVSSGELLEAYGERWSDSKKHEHFVRIQKAASGMTRMLDDILTIGRHDGGLLHFEPRSLPIAGLCGELVEAVAAAHGHTDRIRYRGPAASERAVVDPVLLRHVLENLLSNALKYSPQHTEVELCVAREEDSLRFAVSDRGIGIADEDQPRLFETFHRGKNVGEISGTGLGLAIVQGAVELHGGKVTVQSQLGVGTTFTVRIPLAHGRISALGDAALDPSPTTVYVGSEP